MHDNLKLSKKEKDHLAKIAALYEENRTQLIEQVHETFLSLAYENRFTLHPRRLKELGSEEVERFIAFLRNPDPENVIKGGNDRAFEGLGDGLPGWNC